MVGSPGICVGAIIGVDTGTTRTYLAGELEVVSGEYEAVSILGFVCLGAPLTWFPFGPVTLSALGPFSPS